MKRLLPKSSPPRLSRESERLIASARGLGASGSRVEDRYWEGLIDAEMARLFDAGSEAPLNHALDALAEASPAAYEALLEAAETNAESLSVEREGRALQVLLVAAPVLAWSKYAIPSGPLDATLTRSLHAHLQAHVAAEGTQCALSPYLYSIDQLPKHFSETRALVKTLSQAALSTAAPSAKRGKKLPETAPLLADTRYLLGAIAAPRNAPLFRWQQDAESAPDPASTGKEPLDAIHAGRERVLRQWRDVVHPELAAMLSGCVFELQLPDAYHAACRDSDRAIRPYSIKAALAFLEAALGAEPKQLRAVLGVFGEDEPEEYRIGFTVGRDADVVHGAIWPLYGLDEQTSPNIAQDQIEALLQESGVGEVVMLEPAFPMEFCDDCGAPLFADVGGDLVHAELPEDTEAPSVKHLH